MITVHRTHTCVKLSTLNLFSLCFLALLLRTPNIHAYHAIMVAYIIYFITKLRNNQNYFLLYTLPLLLYGDISLSHGPGSTLVWSLFERKKISKFFWSGPHKLLFLLSRKHTRKNSGKELIFRG